MLVLVPVPVPVLVLVRRAHGRGLRKHSSLFPCLGGAGGCLRFLAFLVWAFVYVSHVVRPVGRCLL